MQMPPRRDAPDADRAPSPWRGARAIRSRGSLALGVAAGAVAYRELLWFETHRTLSEDLEEFFFAPSQGVAPLVVLLSAWLFYRRAGRLASLPRSSDGALLGLVLLATGAVLYAWATLTGSPDLLVPSLALVGLATAALWKGPAAARAVLLPAAFLVFAMPLPAPLANEIVFRLQIATTELTGVLLTLLRVPHHVAGEQILRTHQTFSVIESCSGLRSIETLAMVAVLMADLFRRSTLHAWLLFLAAPPIAFFLNGWRAVALILNPHSQLVAVHNLQGIAILLGGLVVLFALDGVLERAERGRRTGAPPASPPPPPAESTVRADPRLPAAVSLALVALALASIALPRFESPPPEPLQLSDQLALGVGELFSQELETDRLFLGSAGFREIAARRFRRQDHPVDVFVGVGWRNGRARSALSPKTALPGSGWILEAEETLSLPPDGREIRSLLYRTATQRLLVYHWYEGSLGLALETARSLAAVDASPLGRGPEIVAVRIATDVEAPISSGLPPAAARLAAFYADLRRALDRLKWDGRDPRGERSAEGKAFLHFPTREEFFLGPSGAESGRMLQERGVGRQIVVGMALANQAGGTGEARLIRGACTGSGSAAGGRGRGRRDEDSIS
jgi:EpsI family protein